MDSPTYSDTGGVKSTLHPRDLKAIHSLPAQQAAMALSDTLETIFSKMETSLLKNCRLVCHQWKKCATRIMRKRVTIELHLSFEKMSDAHRNKEQIISMEDKYSHPRQILLRKKDSRLGISNLISMLESSDKFPCSSFIISSQALCTPQIQNLLTAVGRHVKQLKLTVVFLLFGETSVLNDLIQLLDVQAPHLQTLDLRIELSSFFTSIVRNWNYFEDFFDRGGNGFREKLYLPNLRSLTIQSPLPLQFFEEIMDGAMNLREYKGFYGGRYFIEGRGKDRVYLLKHLALDIHPEEKPMAIATEILRSNKYHLKLECIRFNSFTLRNGFPSTSRSSDWRKVIPVLNELLDCSSGSLKKLIINPLSFLSGIKIPRMPNLKSLVLLKGRLDLANGSFKEQYFPGEFKMATMFPSLQSITVGCYPFCDQLELDIKSFLNASYPLYSVKNFRMILLRRLSYETCHLLSQALPNAKLCEADEEEKREQYVLM